MTTPNSTTATVEDIARRIRGYLENARQVLVLTHIDPDGDALGTQLAFGRYLAALGKKVTLLRDSKIPEKYAFLPNIERIEKVGKMKAAASFDTVLVLECPTRERLGETARFLDTAETVINIDHHPGNAHTSAVDWVDVTRSSVGEMAYEYFEAAGYQPDAEVATQLYTAILTDTGRFRFESTSPRTLAIAGELVKLGADPRNICDAVYFDQDPALIALTGKVLSSVEYHDDGRICLLNLTRRMLRESGADLANTEGLVDYSLYSRGVQVGALMREIDEHTTKISLRSRNGSDVGLVASNLGGGGHPNAAGCRMPLPLEEAKAKLVELIRSSREA